MRPRGSEIPGLVAPSAPEAYDARDQAEFRRMVTESIFRLAKVDQELPEVESVAISFSDADNKTYTKVVGGKGIFSARVEILSAEKSAKGASITDGSANLTTTTGDEFVAGDVGKTVVVPGAGLDGVDLRAKISAFVGARAVTLDTLAKTSVAGVDVKVLVEHTNEVVDIKAGEEKSWTSAVLTASERDRVWYARATPFAAAAGAGVQGRTVESSVYAGRSFGFMREVVSETSSLGTLTLTPIEGAIFDAVLSSVLVGNQSWDPWAPLTADASGNYVETVALVEKHPSKIAYQVVAKGIIVQENVVTFDLGSEANVIGGPSVSYNGSGTARVKASFDSDVAIGLNAAEYQHNSSGAWSGWIGVDVDVARAIDLTIAQSTTAEFLLRVRGLNADFAAGPYAEVVIEKYVEDVVDPTPPRVTSAAAANLANTPGDCVAKNYPDCTVTWSVSDTSDTSYSIWVERIMIRSSGSTNTLVGVYAIGDTSVVDDLTNFTASAGATDQLYYVVSVVKGSPLHSLDTNTMAQYSFTACA